VIDRPSPKVIVSRPDAVAASAGLVGQPNKPVQ
jgi:hypothetical protein